MHMHMYLFFLWSGGAPRVVTIDDYLPCWANGGGLAYARGSGALLWAPLIEKAFAKVHGGYCYTRLG